MGFPRSRGAISICFSRHYSGPEIRMRRRPRMPIGKKRPSAFQTGLITPIARSSMIPISSVFRNLHAAGGNRAATNQLAARAADRPHDNRGLARDPLVICLDPNTCVDSGMVRRRNGACGGTRAGRPAQVARARGALGFFLNVDAQHRARARGQRHRDLRPLCAPARR